MFHLEIRVFQFVGITCSQIGRCFPFLSLERVVDILDDVNLRAPLLF